MVHRSEILHAPHFGRYYRHQAPAAALADFVESYWYLESYAPIPQGVAEHFLPRLQGQLIFAFDNPCLYQRPDGELQQLNGPQAMGPQARALAWLHPASQGMLGIVLRPGALALLLGEPVGERIQACPALLPIQAELAALPDFASQAAWLDSWLGRVFAQADVAELPSQALSLLAAGVPVAAAAERVGLVPRSLQRQFQRQLGLSPQTCARVLRLRAALQRLWSEANYTVWDAGYCDYAHFFREFKTMNGLAPQAYLGRFESPTQA